MSERSDLVGLEPAHRRLRAERDERRRAHVAVRRVEDAVARARGWIAVQDLEGAGHVPAGG